MDNVIIKAGPTLNISDEVKVTSTSLKKFNLADRNNSGKELILLYMYVLPSFPTHGIKVGMTKCREDETFWQAIKSRISVQEHELALTPEQYEKYGLVREVIHWGICVDANNDSFKDYHVHDAIMAKCAGLVEKEQEWFTNVPADEIIDAFESCRKRSEQRVIYTPRKEQRACVDALKEYFNNHPIGGRFLMNCKMRFGKSYTTYKYCEEAGLDRILILTFVPAVESSWKDDLSHVAKKYDYYTDANVRKDSFLPKFLTNPYVVFLSLQNYLGKDRNSSETKEKIKKLQGVDWDIVVLDEYHFGAWNQRTQGTINEKPEDLDPEYLKGLKETQDVIEKFKIHTDRVLCLSGTPFKALAKGEFNKENTFTYSYFDEQRNKYPLSEEGDFTKVNPDYEAFPDMKIFGYNMSRLFAGMTASVFSGDKLYGKNYFSLNRFFETRRDSNPTEPCTFVYEDEVKNWLEIIKGRSAFGDKFPYSNQKMLCNNKHTLWLLPRTNAVMAMAKLLKEDEYFSKYQIINLSADGVGAGVDAYNYLMRQITAAENTGKLGSIALTVNKLTIGVTVKQWFSVFVLKDLASPEQYFQSIFRIQTPYKKNGIIVKPYGYVYDFNIDRAAALLLNYAEQSQEGSVTKLQIAKLIVKYLPIYMNGDMSTPISESVFYELAEFGDSSGIPLSRKITDTTKTTRMLDDEVMAEMLNDKDCSEIIKRVFAHAKFNKPKTQTMLQKPEADGFQTKIAKEGRDKGYSLGLEDSEKYVDFDDNEIQAEFEKAIADYLKNLCPNDGDENHTTWWSNGFIKGYEGGVNAPIKKMKCGHDDGVKFCEEIRKKLGSKIVWKEDTKRPILDIAHKHLNDINNIPKEYRGALYKRWYCDSFKQAIKNTLAPEIPYEKGKSVEDADNVLRHILARLFEFLYISVYRETTFNEIFKNADPDIFLEAVGITKKDFEVLNKYHIFQENVLNNYIHDFFVNESLGSKLNLEDEEVKKQYRNSFDWFGFGLEQDDRKLAMEAFTESVNSNLTAMAESDSSEADEPIEATNEPDESVKNVYFFAYDELLNRNQITIRCPEAKKVGQGIVKGYRLCLVESVNSSRLSLSPVENGELMVGIFSVPESSLHELEAYAASIGGSRLDLSASMIGDETDTQTIGFTYIFGSKETDNAPESRYMKSVLDGYKEFGISSDVVDNLFSIRKAEIRQSEATDLDEHEIEQLLRKNPKGLKASQIAKLLGSTKKAVNRILYANQDRFSVSFFTWHIKKDI